MRKMRIFYLNNITKIIGFGKAKKRELQSASPFENQR